MTQRKQQKTGQYGVRAKKYLGQHFLKDEHIAKKISDTAAVQITRNLLEIGPGTGVLTQFLVEKDIDLCVMEIDKESIAYLDKDFREAKLTTAQARFTLLEADFLKYDLDRLFPGQEFQIIGNFPYNISSQILFKALENRHRIPVFSGMFQKEVARRICEKPGTKNYGILSVLTQAFYTAEFLFSVPPSVFIPPPKVDSGVIRLTRKTDYQLDCDEDLFFKVVKQAFQQRRKTLRNSLKSLSYPDSVTAKDLFNKRPEQLEVAEFVYLTQLLDTQ